MDPSVQNVPRHYKKGLRALKHSKLGLPCHSSLAPAARSSLDVPLRRSLGRFRTLVDWTRGPLPLHKRRTLIGAGKQQAGDMASGPEDDTRLQGNSTPRTWPLALGEHTRGESQDQNQKPCQVRPWRCPGGVPPCTAEAGPCNSVTVSEHGPATETTTIVPHAPASGDTSPG